MKKNACVGIAGDILHEGYINTLKQHQNMAMK
jgi:hypothetical protein